MPNTDPSDDTLLHELIDVSIDLGDGVVTNYARSLFVRVRIACLNMRLYLSRMTLS